MATNQCHEPGVIKAFHQCLLLLSISSFIRCLTRVYGFIRNSGHTSELWGLLLLLHNIHTHGINFILGKEITQIIKRGAITGGVAMAVKEVSICGDVDVTAICKGPAKCSTTKTGWTPLDEDLGTAVSGQGQLVGRYATRSDSRGDNIEGCHRHLFLWHHEGHGLSQRGAGYGL